MKAQVGLRAGFILLPPRVRMGRVRTKSFRTQPGLSAVPPYFAGEFRRSLFPDNGGANRHDLLGLNRLFDLQLRSGFQCSCAGYLPPIGRQAADTLSLDAVSTYSSPSVLCCQISGKLSLVSRTLTHYNAASSTIACGSTVAWFSATGDMVSRVRKSCGDGRAVSMTTCHTLPLRAGQRENWMALAEALNMK